MRRRTFRVSITRDQIDAFLRNPIDGLSEPGEELALFQLRARFAALPENRQQSVLRRFGLALQREVRALGGALSRRATRKTAFGLAALLLGALDTEARAGQEVVTDDPDFVVEIFGGADFVLDCTADGLVRTQTDGRMVVHTVACADVRSLIIIVATPDRTSVDLSAVSPKTFPMVGQVAVTGGEADDTLIGTDFDDRLFAAGGNDVLMGGLGDDRIEGGAGQDEIDGGGGNDVLAGGLGDDLMSGAAGADQLDGGGGNDVLMGGLGDDLVLGGEGSNTIDGGAGSDTLIGGPERDMVFGGRGQDWLEGGGGNDVLIGGVGDDVVLGNAGDDALDHTAWAGQGRDTLVGGPGDDTLYSYPIQGGDRDLLVGQSGSDRYRVWLGSERVLLSDQAELPADIGDGGGESPGDRDAAEIAAGPTPDTLDVSAAEGGVTIRDDVSGDVLVATSAVESVALHTGDEPETTGDTVRAMGDGSVDVLIDGGEPSDAKPGDQLATNGGVEHKNFERVKKARRR
jgi:hypothetical protein